MSKKTVNFHIKSDDYFGTLATTLGLVEQKILTEKRHKIIFQKLVQDLMYLQTEYRIIKKYEKNYYHHS